MCLEVAAGFVIMKSSFIGSMFSVMYPVMDFFDMPQLILGQGRRRKVQVAM